LIDRVKYLLDQGLTFLTDVRGYCPKKRCSNWWKFRRSPV